MEVLRFNTCYVVLTLFITWSTLGFAQSNNDIAESNVSIEEPNINIEEPNINNEEPNINIEEPNINIEEPNINIEEPKPNVDIDERNVNIEDPYNVNIAQLNVHIENVKIPKLIVNTPESNVNNATDFLHPAPISSTTPAPGHLWEHVASNLKIGMDKVWTKVKQASSKVATEAKMSWDKARAVKFDDVVNAIPKVGQKVKNWFSDTFSRKKRYISDNPVPRFNSLYQEQSDAYERKQMDKHLTMKDDSKKYKTEDLTNKVY